VASDNCTVLKAQRYSNFVAKLTLMIEDRLFRDAGLIALKQGTSLEELVREYLENLVAAKSLRDESKKWLLNTRFDYKAGDFDRDSSYQRWGT